MAIIRPGGIIIVDGKPVHTPINFQGTIALLEGENTGWLWNGVDWDTEYTWVDDADVVHIAGIETITGAKTFSINPTIPDEAYGVGWDGALEPPTKNALYDVLQSLGTDTLVVHKAGAENITGVKTFTVDPVIPDEAYGAPWNGALEPATKNAIYDKIEALDLLLVHLAGAENITGVKTFTVPPIVPVEAYGSGWNGNNSPPTMNDVYDEMELRAVDADVVHIAGIETITGAKTFSIAPIIPYEIYGVGWNGVLEPPTKDAVYDKIQTLADDVLVVHLAGAENITGVKTFTVDPIVPPEVYGVGWNGSNEPATKNDVYDKMEAVVSSISGLATDTLVVHKAGAENITGVKTFTVDPLIPDEVYSSSWNGVLEPPTKNAVYDEIESFRAAAVLLAGSQTITGVKTFSQDPIIPDEGYGVGWNASMEPATKNALYDKIETLAAVLPASIFKADISQAGTSAPTAPGIGANTLGEVPTYTYNGVGDYELNVVAPIFTSGGKTHVQNSLGANATASTLIQIRAYWLDTTTIKIEVTDDTNTPVEIHGNFQISIEIFT